MSEKFRVMVRASEEESQSVESSLSQLCVDEVCPSNTHYENGFVRAVYNIPDDFDFDEFEDAAYEALEGLFPGSEIQKRATVVHLKR